MFSSVCINETFAKIFVSYVGNAGSRGNIFIWNHLVQVSRHTSTEHGKYFNVVEQFLEGLTSAGHILALDNVFSRISILQTVQMSEIQL